MATVHVLESNGEHVRVVVHQAVPAGSNTSSITWKNVVLGAGLNKTVLVEGTGAGQILTAEKATILTGDVVEMDLQVPLFSGGVTVGQINAVITDAVSAWIRDFKARYKHYGREIA